MFYKVEPYGPFGLDLVKVTNHSSLPLHGFDIASRTLAFVVMPEADLVITAAANEDTKWAEYAA